MSQWQSQRPGVGAQSNEDTSGDSACPDDLPGTVHAVGVIVAALPPFTRPSSERIGDAAVVSGYTIVQRYRKHRRADGDLDQRRSSTIGLGFRYGAALMALHNRDGCRLAVSRAGSCHRVSEGREQGAARELRESCERAVREL